MQLIYLIDIFQDSYNIVRDCFKTDSVNEMKKIGRLLQRNNESFKIYSLGSAYQKTMKIVTKNNNTQIVCKPYWFVTNSSEK